MRVFRILTEPTSTPMRDEDADLVGRCEDHVGAVAHHARLDDGGRAFLRAVAADIGFEPQVPLPKIADLSVGRGDLVGVDFFLTGCGIQSLNLWGFCNGLRLFFFGHSQDCFLLTCQE